MKSIEVTIYNEVCCELCQEIIHNHFEECPACGKNYAGTSAYFDLNDTYMMEPSIKCEECGAEFRPDENVKDFDWYWNCWLIRVDNE